MKTLLITLFTLGSLTASAQTTTPAPTIAKADYCTLKVYTSGSLHSVSMSCNNSYEIENTTKSATSHENFLSEAVTQVHQKMQENNFLNLGCLNTTLLRDFTQTSDAKTFECLFVKQFLNTTGTGEDATEATPTSPLYNLDVKR